MSIRGTVIMLLLCLGLGAFWYIHDYKGEAQREEAKTQEERIFPGVKAEDIVGIRWTTKKDKKTEERVLKYDQGLWLMSENGQPQCVASVSDTKDLVKRIAESARLSVILEDPKAKDYATFSLDQPEYELELTVKTGDQPENKCVLRIGAETPDGEANYVYVEGRQPILEAAVNFKHFFLEKDIDVREKSALIVSPEQIEGLTLHQAGREDIVLKKTKSAASADAAEQNDEPQKEGDSQWDVVKPQQVRADFNAVNDYLWQLHELEVIRFIPPVEQSRLGQLRTSWDVVTEAGRTVKVELWGASDSQGDKFFMRRPQTNEYMIAARKTDNAALEIKSAGNFEDHHLAAVSADDIRRIEMTLPAEPDKPAQEQVLNLDVRKIRDGWEVRKPEPFLRDEEKRNSEVFRVFYALTDLKWRDKHPGEGGKLTGNCAEVVLYGEKDKVLTRLRVSAEGSAERGYGAVVEGSDTLFVLEKDQVKRWRSFLSSLRESDKKDKTDSAENGKQAADAGTPSAAVSVSPSAAVPAAAVSASPSAAAPAASVSASPSAAAPSAVPSASVQQ